MSIDRKVAVIGLGYVGLPLLHLLTKKKINCFGFDIDQRKIELLKKGKSYISDIQNKDLKILNKNNLFNMNEIQNVNKVDYIVICLPTPLAKNHQPDMSIIINAFNKLKKYIKKQQTIILESTVYPGATREIFCDYLSVKFNLGKNIFLGYSSERISPGQTDRKIYKYFLENTPKVISGFNEKSLKKIYQLYREIFEKIYKAKSLEIAEMSKLVENSYRSVNIGLANELKTICHKLKIDIYQVIATAGTKPFGFNRFYPGPGVGGHCIPIDPIFFKWIAKKNGINAKFISLARSTNLNITKWVINQIFKQDPKIQSTKHKIKILLIGIAYKPDVNDTRESPSIKIYKSLIKFNNVVHYNDSKIPKIKLLNKTLFSTPLNRVKNYDYVIIGTDHSDLNKNMILKNSKKIFDTRGLFREVNSKKIIKI